jgi:hypothetical protein
MNKILSFLLFLLLNSFAFSQSNYNFLYDESGNCIRKYMTVVMSYAPANPNSDNDYVEEDPQPQSDLLGDLKVTVYPIPTDGVLQVVISNNNENIISGSKDELIYRFTLLDASGKLLQSFTTQSTTNTIDLTNYPAGNYILRLQAGDKMSYFHIIKL